MNRFFCVVCIFSLAASVTWAAPDSTAPLAAHAIAANNHAETMEGPTVRMEHVSFDLPTGWQREQPSSHMRAAQATIPGEGGPAQLAVFYFGEGKGGSVDANIERWIGQVEPAPGTKPERAQFETHGLTVTWVDVAGTLKPSGMGMGPSTAQPNSRLLAAVVEGPGGPWFFRATGPDKTLAPQRDNFVAMLKSLHPTGS